VLGPERGRHLHWRHALLHLHLQLRPLLLLLHQRGRAGLATNALHASPGFKPPRSRVCRVRSGDGRRKHREKKLKRECGAVTGGGMEIWNRAEGIFGGERWENAFKGGI
jgi:hypothetical protein